MFFLQPWRAAPPLTVRSRSVDMMRCLLLKHLSHGEGTENGRATSNTSTKPMAMFWMIPVHTVKQTPSVPQHQSLPTSHMPVFTPGDTTNSFLAPEATLPARLEQEKVCSSVLKKRRKKMNKHKYRKWRRRTRFIRRALQKG